jgi:hypothetical protein
MDLVLALTGNLERSLKSRTRPVAQAATLALRDVEKTGKAEMRQQVRRNFKRTPPAARRAGQNFEKSFRWTTYPKGRKRFSLAAAGVVDAQADYADIFRTGGPVRAAKGELAIALPPAKSAGWDRGSEHPTKGLDRYRKYSQVAAAQAAVGPLFRLPARGGAILAADREKARAAGVKRLGRQSRKRNFVPLFYLTRSVRLPDLLDFMGPVEAAQRDLPGRFVDRFERLERDD